MRGAWDGMDGIGMTLHFTITTTFTIRFNTFFSAVLATVGRRFGRELPSAIERHEDIQELYTTQLPSRIVAHAMTTTSSLFTPQITFPQQTNNSSPNKPQKTQTIFNGLFDEGYFGRAFYTFWVGFPLKSKFDECCCLSLDFLLGDRKSVV